MYRIRIDRKQTCPKHPYYNPENDGAGGIKGGCQICQAIHSSERAAHVLKTTIARGDDLIIRHQRAHAEPADIRHAGHPTPQKGGQMGLYDNAPKHPRMS